MVLSMMSTIKDVLFWEYAKLIPSGYSDKEMRMDLIMSNYWDLKSGAKRFTDPVFEDLEMERGSCAYCRTPKGLSEAYLVPDRGCITTDSHNTVHVCKGCRQGKGGQDLLDWRGIEGFQGLHPALKRKYLRMLYLCHECRGLLDQHIPSEGSDLSELAQVFKQPCFSFQSKANRDTSGVE